MILVTVIVIIFDFIIIISKFCGKKKVEKFYFVSVLSESCLAVPTNFDYKKSLWYA